MTMFGLRTLYKSGIQNSMRRSLSSKVVVSSKLTINGLSLGGVEQPSSFPEFMLNKMKEGNKGGDVAIVDGSTNEELTYDQLYTSTYSFADKLRTQFNIGKDDTVGIYSPNHLHYFTVFQGIGLTGGRSTPINPLYTEEEVEP